MYDSQIKGNPVWTFGDSESSRCFGYHRSRAIKEKYSVADPKRKLKNAQSAIDRAHQAMRLAQEAVPESQDIKSALAELSDAEDNIRRALRELPDENTAPLR